jgi:hypothetical protein
MREYWRPEDRSRNRREQKGERSLSRANAPRVNTETGVNFREEGRGFSGYVPERGRPPHYPGAQDPSPGVLTRFPLHRKKKGRVKSGQVKVGLGWNGRKKGVKLLWKYARAPRTTRSTQERRQKSGRRSNRERKEANRPPLKLNQQRQKEARTPQC